MYLPPLCPDSSLCGGRAWPPLLLPLVNSFSLLGCNASCTDQATNGQSITERRGAAPAQPAEQGLAGPSSLRLKGVCIASAALLDESSSLFLHLASAAALQDGGHCGRRCRCYPVKHDDAFEQDQGKCCQGRPRAAMGKPLGLRACGAARRKNWAGQKAAALHSKFYKCAVRCAGAFHPCGDGGAGIGADCRPVCQAADDQPTRICCCHAGHLHPGTGMPRVSDAPTGEQRASKGMLLPLRACVSGAGCRPADWAVCSPGLSPPSPPSAACLPCARCCAAA